MDAYKRICFFFLLISCSTIGHSQTIDTNKNIRLKPGFHRLDSVLQFASQQTGVVFSYNSKKINTRQNILLKDGVVSLAQILERLKQEKGVSVKIIENYIVITSTETKASEKNTPANLGITKSKPAVDPNNLKPGRIQSSPVTSKTVGKIKPDSNYVLAKIDSLPIVAQKKIDTTSIVDSTSLTNGAIQPQQPIVKRAPTPIDSAKKLSPTANTASKKNPLPEKKVSKPKQATNKSPFFLKSGIVIDESLYLGAIAQIGFPLLYGTVSANTNFCVSQIRYGAGTSFKLNNKFQLHLNFNVGDLQKSGQFSDSSSTHVPITVKSQLTRVMIGLEHSVNKKIKIQFGLLFNNLKTNYLINSVPSDLHVFKESGDHLFYNINPPYVITNTYSPTSSSNIKTWLGLQVSVLYSLNF